MSPEWTRRVKATVGWLLVAELLQFVPLPGLWSWESVASLVEGAGLPAALLMHGELSVAAAGIAPYVVASMLVVLVRGPRGDARPFAPSTLEWPTRALTIPIAMLLGVLVAARWEILQGIRGIVPIDFGTIGLVAFSTAAGTMLLVAIAGAITRSGLANGVCLLVLVQVVKLIAIALMPSPDSQAPGFERFLAAVGSAFVIVFAVQYLRSRFALSLSGAPEAPPDDESRNAGPSVVLRKSGVGILAIQCAAAAVAVLAVFLPVGSPGRQALDLAGGPGVGWAIALVALSAPLTLVLVSWSYDTGRLAKLAAGVERPVEPREFDRPLEKEVLPGLFVLVVVFAGWTMLSGRTATGLPGLIQLVLVAAIALALFERWELHGRLAQAFASPDDESRCGCCDADSPSGAAFCRRCGCAFGEEARCAAHVDRTATARCVVCLAVLCDECDHPQSGCHLCERHAGVEVVDGWVVAARPGTHAEAQLVRHRLATEGVGSEILDTTVAPVYGTLGIYDVVPAFPLAACSSLGGGSVRLLVRASDLDRALRSIGPGGAEA